MDVKKKKEETVITMMNAEGKKETDSKKIENIFIMFYNNLFKPNHKGNTIEEKEAKEIQDIIFESIREIAERDGKIIRNKLKELYVFEGLGKTKVESVNAVAPPNIA